jgi:membrane protease YdiL (CAAX protease family)
MAMDRRLTVIITICLMEAVFRSFAGYAPVGGLTYTLAARLVQMAVILASSLSLCGVIHVNLAKELGIGLTVAIVFGALVFLADISSRIVLPGGLLNLLLAKQHVDKPILFFLTGCLVGPFVEELFFRGLLYSWMRERIPVILSILLTSLLFASLHGLLSPVQLMGGIIFASIFEWRKNIWAPFVIHSLANLGIWMVPYVYPLM